MRTQSFLCATKMYPRAGQLYVHSRHCRRSKADEARSNPAISQLVDERQVISTD